MEGQNQEFKVGDVYQYTFQDTQYTLTVKAWDGVRYSIVSSNGPNNTHHLSSNNFSNMLHSHKAIKVEVNG